MELDVIKKVDPAVAEAIEKELDRQRNTIELIASENFTSPAVMAACGSVLTNKYAEGKPHKRFYNGCENVDVIEELAQKRACELFKMDHANVQPHSGAQANMAVFMYALNIGDTVLGMDLSNGGHLSHGSPVNFSGINYNIVSYGVNDNGEIDYDEVEKLAKEHKPKMIIAGASNYSRIIDFKRLSEIAKSVGAYLMVDMAHIAGLVAAGCHPSPVGYADVVTTTTHKTLRGPRGGIIMCDEEHAAGIDKAVFPGMQGGPLMHIIAAKAVSFKEALSDEFKTYQQQVVSNAQALARSLTDSGVKLVSGGTDNHLMLVDLTNDGITGKELEKLLDEVHITANKNGIPFDKASPFITSGLRLGTPSVTTRGMKEPEMKIIGEVIADVIKRREDALDESREKVLALTEKFPLYANDIIE